MYLKRTKSKQQQNVLQSLQKLISNNHEETQSKSVP